MNYSRYYTPSELSKSLSKYAPRNIHLLLEPSAGNGELLRAMLGKLQRVKKVYCVDIDAIALGNIRAKYGSLLGNKLKLVNDDFLKWSIKEGTLIDCIIMNPPFSGKRGTWVQTDEIISVKQHPEFPSRIPIELAFLVKSINILKEGGRLLAVLPSSVVASQQGAWFRKFLNASGEILRVHELPNRTFKTVEARIYLLVFEKGKVGSKVQLYNHDLNKPHKLKIDAPASSNDYRLDYGYYIAETLFKKFYNSNHIRESSPLQNLVLMFRGTEPSPDGLSYAIHTTEYKDGFWYKGSKSRAKKHKSFNVLSDKSIQPGDILVKRVGRGCAHSFGYPIELHNFNCTDCVLVIRPNPEVYSVSLLFMLRTLFCWDMGSQLIERGTGAAYLTVKELSKIAIPTSLSPQMYSLISRYKKAVVRQDISTMKHLESTARQLILW